MTIAFDAAATGLTPSSRSVNAVTPSTFSHTVGSGSDRLLLVHIYVQSSTLHATAVTFNGVSMAHVGAATAGLSTDTWALVAPAAGTHTVSISWSGTGSLNIGATATSWTGVDPVAPYGTYSAKTGTVIGGGTITSNAVTSEAGGLVVDTLSFADSAANLTADGSQTVRFNSASNPALMVSEKAGAASVTTQWTNSGGGASYAIVLIPLHGHTSWADVATRLLMRVRGYADVATRLGLKVARNIATRVNLRIGGYQDVGTRLSMPHGYPDIRSRLHLRFIPFADVATRLRVPPWSYVDVGTRLLLNTLRDVPSRLVLRVYDFTNTATRLALRAVRFADVRTRLALSRLGHADVATRLYLTHHLTWADAGTRVNIQRDTTSWGNRGIVAILGADLDGA